MAPETLVHPETGEVYIKAFDWRKTPLLDIALSVLLALLVGVLIVLHVESLAFDAPSPLFYPHLQFAQYLLEHGADVFHQPFSAGLFPLYGYVVAGIMAVTGGTFDGVAPVLFVLNSVAYVTSSILMYLLLRQGFGYGISFALSLLVFAAPAGMTSLVALTPLPLFWLGCLCLFQMMQWKREKETLPPVVVGTAIAVLLGIIHPVGLAVMGAWAVALLCMGNIGFSFMSILLLVSVLATLPGVQMGAALFPVSSELVPNATDALGASSLTLPSGIRVAGLFEAIYQMGSGLMLQPDANLAHWPLGEGHQHWWPQLLNQLYRFFLSSPWLVWPLGFVSTLCILFKSVQVFITQRNATNLLFLTWSLFFLIITAFVMPKLFLSGQQVALYVLPILFLFMAIMIHQLKEWVVTRPIVLPAQALILGFSTFLVLLFQLQVGYEALGNWYTSTPQANEATLAFPTIETTANAPSPTRKPQGYANMAIAGTKQQDRSRQMQGVIPASLYGWLNRDVAVNDCFISFYPGVDAASLRRQVYHVPESHRINGSNGELSPTICPYFVEHKAISTDYDWVLALNQGSQRAQMVYDDRNARGWRIWRIRPSSG
jgi:hypothetical protein